MVVRHNNFGSLMFPGLQDPGTKHDVEFQEEMTTFIHCNCNYSSFFKRVILSFLSDFFDFIS